MKPAFIPNQQRREDLVKLVEYVKARHDGDRVSWLEIETATGVSMSGDYGRGLLRVASRRAARPYMPLPGHGVEFSSPDNANEIAQKAVGSIATAVVRGAHRVATLCDRHIEKMSAEQSRLLTAKQAFLASMTVSTSLSRRLPSK